MTALLFAAAAAAPSPAPAPTPDGPSDAAPVQGVADEADHLFRLGLRDHEAGRFDDALAHLLASMRLVPNRNVAFNVAACYEALGRPEQAWQFYHDYTQGSTDPAARAEGEAALARLGPGVARVAVTSEPPGAAVYVGRKDLGAHGVTPLVLGLPEGPTTILVERDGRSAETTVTLAKGREVPARLVVPPPPPPPPPEPAPPPPPPEPAFEALLHLGDDVIARVTRDRCELVPPLLASGTAPSAAPTPREAAPGSVGLALVPTLELALDVKVGAGAAARGILRPLERHALVLDDTAGLRRWVFERCEVTDARALAGALGKVPVGLRGTVVAVFAEWAAARGATDSQLGLRCLQGDCAPLATAIAGPAR